jgi:hypothetical protein
MCGWKWDFSSHDRENCENFLLFPTAVFIDLGVIGYTGPRWLWLLVPRQVGHVGAASTSPWVERRDFSTRLPQ